jgi:hypothetical protein
VQKQRASKRPVGEPAAIIDNSTRILASLGFAGSGGGGM